MNFKPSNWGIGMNVTDSETEYNHRQKSIKLCSRLSGRSEGEVDAMFRETRLPAFGYKTIDDFVKDAGYKDSAWDYVNGTIKRIWG